MRTKGIIIFLIIVINVMFFNINVVQASGITDVITGADDFLAAGSGENIGIDESKLQSTSKSISNILILLGICVAVIVAAMLGIKFMIGSIEEQAKVKEALVPFVIGCIVVFGSFGIWKMFVQFGNEVFDSNSGFVKVDGKLYEKGKLCCKNCAKKVDEKTIEQGFCSGCGTTFNNKCTYCGNILTYDEVLSGKCKHTRVPVSIDLFVIYE